MSILAPKDLAGELAQLPHALAKEIHRQTHHFVKASAIAHSPVGGAKDKNPGRLKRSWKDTPANIESAIEALKPTHVESALSHSFVIERGRRRSQRAFTVRIGQGTVLEATKRRRKSGTLVKRHRAAYYTVKAGKILGSEQAPFGIKHEVFRDLDAQRDSILTSAIAKVERD